MANMSASKSQERRNRVEPRLLPFGPLTEIVPSTATVRIELPLTGATLRQEILSAYPELRERRFRVAVDRRLAGDEGMITEAGEIALLPPFAGG